MENRGNTKTLVFSLTMVNLVNKSIPYSLITTGVLLEGEGGRSPLPFLEN